MANAPTHQAGTGAQRAAGPVIRKKTKRPSRLSVVTRGVFRGLLVLIALFFAGLLLRGHYAVIPTEKKLQKYLDSGTYLNGIIIDGKNVAGMTLAEARNALLPAVEQAAASINITVKHDNAIWLFTAADLRAQTNLDHVLCEAMLFGRGDTNANNAKARKELQQNNQRFSSGFSADEPALQARLSAIGEGINMQPIEPFAQPNLFWISSESKLPSFSYTEGQDGYILDEAALSDEILSCLKSGVYQAVLDPELVRTAPAQTLRMLQDVTQLRASWQTSFGGSRSARNASRVGNIQKSTTLLNGAMVQPGETFDFNEFIGPRTESRGWPLAPGIVDGERYELQAGGGICQVSTTLYNALLRAGAVRSDVSETAQAALAAPLNITERNKHSWPSSYADRGLDATVSTGGKNLIFINQTNSPLYIFADCNQQDYLMTIYLYGEPLPNGITYVAEGLTMEEIPPDEPIYTDNPAWPMGYEQTTVESRKGYRADVYLYTYQDGQEISKDLIYTERYRAVTAKITRGIGDASLPTPTAAP
ncbi:MAG: VanW family protein [Christensenellaceae bacterium]|nr:VanW family protein [Christensenellaceae bacterium]